MWLDAMLVILAFVALGLVTRQKNRAFKELNDIMEEERKREARKAEWQAKMKG